MNCVKSEMWKVSGFHLRVKWKIVSILVQFWILSCVLLIIEHILKDSLNDFSFSKSVVVLVLVITSWNLCINPLSKVFEAFIFLLEWASKLQTQEQISIIVSMANKITNTTLCRKSNEEGDSYSCRYFSSSFQPVWALEVRETL